MRFLRRLVSPGLQKQKVIRAVRRIIVMISSHVAFFIQACLVQSFFFDRFHEFLPHAGFAVIRNYQIDHGLSFPLYSTLFCLCGTVPVPCRTCRSPDQFQYITDPPL